MLCCSVTLHLNLLPSCLIATLRCYAWALSRCPDDTPSLFSVLRISLYVSLILCVATSTTGGGFQLVRGRGSSTIRHCGGVRPSLGIVWFLTRPLYLACILLCIVLYAFSLCSSFLSFHRSYFYGELRSHSFLCPGLLSHMLKHLHSLEQSGITCF